METTLAQQFDFVFQAMRIARTSRRQSVQNSPKRKALSDVLTPSLFILATATSLSRVLYAIQKRSKKCWQNVGKAWEGHSDVLTPSLFILATATSPSRVLYASQKSSKKMLAKCWQSLEGSQRRPHTVALHICHCHLPFPCALR